MNRFDKEEDAAKMELESGLAMQTWFKAVCQFLSVLTMVFLASLAWHEGKELITDIAWNQGFNSCIRAINE